MLTGSQPGATSAAGLPCCVDWASWHSARAAAVVRWSSVLGGGSCQRALGRSGLARAFQGCESPSGLHSPEGNTVGSQASKLPAAAAVTADTAAEAWSTVIRLGSLCLSRASLSDMAGATK